MEDTIAKEITFNLNDINGKLIKHAPDCFERLYAQAKLNEAMLWMKAAFNHKDNASSQTGRKKDDE